MTLVSTVLSAWFRLRLVSPGSLDLEGARRALEQAAIQQRVPRPRIGEWWRDVLTRMAEFVAGIFDLSSATVQGLLTFASWGLIGMAALVLLGWAATAILRSRSPREDPPDGGTTTALLLDRASAEDWEKRLRDALAAADISEALRAQWQVLFERLRSSRSAGPGSRQWTTRLLRTHLTTTSRSAAAGLARLERWTYGGHRPAIEELRDLQAEFDRAVPQPVDPGS